jgi:NHL repeat
MRRLRGLIVLVAAAALAPAAEAAVPCTGSPCPAAAESWPGFEVPRNVGATASENVFVFDGDVYALSPSGARLFDWQPPHPYYMAADRGSERVAVVESQPNRVEWFDGATGDSLGSFPVAGGTFLSLAVDPRPPSADNPNAGAVYVGYFDGWVREYTRDGQFVREWKLPLPWGLDVDARGNVWVSTQVNAAGTQLGVYRYSPDTPDVNGNPDLTAGFFPNFGVLVMPLGLAVDDAYVYVADEWNSKVYVFTYGGTRVATVGAPGAGEGYLWGPTDVSLDGRGGLLVADAGNSRVVHYVYAAATGSGGRVRVSRGGVARVRLACRTRCRGVLALSARGRVLARARFKLGPGGGSVRVRLPRAALRRVARGRLRVVASATTRGPEIRSRRRLVLLPNLRANAGVSPVAAATAPADTVWQR